MNASRYCHDQDYYRIAEAIAFMRQHHLQQPDLSSIANRVGLSTCYFQRLFTRWAGISPKRFSQYLTIEYAKSKMTETKSLLDVTLESGLSSPGRLHDLFVRLEAMSPGEFKRNGKGLNIRYGVGDTRFGPCLIATTERGICNLAFIDDLDRFPVRDWLQNYWSEAEIIADENNIQPLCDRIFDRDVLASNSDLKPLTLFIKGTNFQIQVWRALLDIPFAGLTSYQTIARQIERPAATRAVGNAIGNNPIAYLIPCHRVLRQSGELGGYRWGLERKGAMIAWEASQLV